MCSLEQTGLAVGVDIGGTNLRCAVVDQAGQILALIRTTSSIAEPKKGREILVQAIRDVTAQAGVRLGDLQGVGLGVPGWMDRISKRLVLAPKMAHWQGVFDLDTIRKELGLPVYADSDPNVATLGELWVGAGRGSRNFIMITLGTGLGCGIVIDGKLYVGEHGMAGEFGHIVINDVAERLCDCGTMGCLEAQTAGPAIARQGRREVESGKATLISELINGQAEDVTTSVVVSAAKKGDPIARSIIEHAGELLGIGFANMVYLFEPEKFIVGGGMAAVGDLILEPIRRTMAERCYLIARGYISVEIVPAELGDDAGVIGAARLAFSGSNKE